MDAILDRYEILSDFGERDGVHVFKVRQKALGTICLLKVVSHINVGTSVASIFEREAKAITVLNHEHVLAAFDFAFSPLGEPYMVTQFENGQHLSDLLQVRHKLPAAEAIPLFLQVCEGLIYAHSRGIVHGSLKPSSIVLGSDSTGSLQAKITDFGLGKLVDAADDAFDAGELAGIVSSAYQCPEFRIHPMDSRSDIYSLGMIMLETVSGKLSWDEFRGSTALRATKNLSNRSQTVIPIALVNLIDKCLHHDPERRWQNVTDIKESLGAVQSKLPRQRSTPAFFFESLNSRAAKIAATAAFVLIFAGTIVYLCATLFSTTLTAGEPPPTSAWNSKISEAAPISDYKTADSAPSKVVSQKVDDDAIPAPLNSASPPHASGSASRNLHTSLAESDLRSGRVELPNEDMDDGELRAFESLPNGGLIKILKLRDNPITSSGIKHLAELRSLTNLSLEGTDIDDNAIGIIVTQWPNLTDLGLSRTKITDSGLPALAGCQHLRRLYLKECPNVSNEAIADLQKRLQHCRIDYNWNSATKSNRSVSVQTWNHPGITKVINAKGQTVLADKTFTLYADSRGWLNTGMIVDTKDRIWLDSRSDGLWRTNPNLDQVGPDGFPGKIKNPNNCIDVDGPPAGLIGFIGDDPPNPKPGTPGSTNPRFFVPGKTLLNFQPKHSGAISLIVNDNGRGDNSGSQTLRVIVSR